MEESTAVSNYAAVRNEIHVCEAPNVVYKKEFKDLGVTRMDPNEVPTKTI